MEFQMRNTTFISSVVLSVACVSAANAALTFDNFLTAQSTFAGPTAWASPPASQPIFGASGTRLVYAVDYDNGGSPSSASVSGGTATLTASGQGAAGLQYDGNAQDLTGYTFSFDLSLSGLPGSAKATMLFYGTGGFQALYNVNYTGAGSYTVDLSTGPTWASGPFTPVNSFSLYLQNDNATSNSLTLSVSNFTYTPAPGAIALLGAAGLIGARRRRD